MGSSRSADRTRASSPLTRQALLGSSGCTSEVERSWRGPFRTPERRGDLARRNRRVSLAWRGAGGTGQHPSTYAVSEKFRRALSTRAARVPRAVRVLDRHPSVAVESARSASGDQFRVDDYEAG